MAVVECNPGRCTLRLPGLTLTPGVDMINDDERRWPEVPVEDEPGRPDEADDLELPGDDMDDLDLPAEDPLEDLPDDYKDVPEPLVDGDETDPDGARESWDDRLRQPGLSKDEYEAKHGSPTDRKQ